MRLLVIIYIAFIGLGLPDSLFGTAWPAIYADLQLPFSYGSFVTTLVFFGTMISSMFSAKLINRFGTGKVAAVSTLLTAIAMLGYSFVPNYIFLLLCALPLGLGAGAIDTSLNNYIAVHYSAKHMNFLHCFYGIGITVSPIILAKTMEAASGWRNGYRIAFAIQILITLLLFVTLPWWRKRGRNQEDNEEQVLVLSLKEIMATPGIKLIWILFVATCAIECTCGTWGGTYLVEAHAMNPDTAAGLILFYFLGVALGRFVAGILSEWMRVYRIICFGMIVIVIGCILLFVAKSTVILVIGLALIGIGNGPMFPNFNYITPLLYGEDKSPALIGTEYTSASIATMTVPIIVGQIAAKIGFVIFPYVIAISIVIMAIAFGLLYFRMVSPKKEAS